MHPPALGHQESLKSHGVSLQTLSRRRKVLSLSLMLFPFPPHPLPAPRARPATPRTHPLPALSRSLHLAGEGSAAGGYSCPPSPNTQQSPRICPRLPPWAGCWVTQPLRDRRRAGTPGFAQAPSGGHTHHTHLLCCLSCPFTEQKGNVSTSAAILLAELNSEHLSPWGGS